MRIGIVGGGVLGRAVARGFLEHAEVQVYDVVPERRTHDLKDAATADIVFVCLPTPPNPDGTCDTRAIDEFLDEAKRERWWSESSCYVLRSTVPVGYTQNQAERESFKLPILHSPEFLTARCALVDFQTPARNIIGVPSGKYLHCAGCGKRNRPANFCMYCGHKLKSSDEDVACELVRATSLGTIRELYSRRFPGVPVHVMSSNESELVKLATNAFFATKVTFFNVIAEMAKASGCDWEKVRAGILSDGRIAHAHTMVPGQSGAVGYSGACLPKDVCSLYRCAQAAGIDASVLKAVHLSNQQRRSPVVPGGLDTDLD